VTATVSSARGAGRRSARPTWPHDLTLGIRLAVGGGRTSWSRLVLGTIGIGLAVAVLLIAASVPSILAHRNARQLASQPITTAQPGISPLYVLDDSTDFDGQGIIGRYVFAGGANAPVWPGLTRTPGPNEVVVSPALADLLASPAGALLRPRFPERVVGTIGVAGLNQPSDLIFVAGADAALQQASQVQQVYGFGGPGTYRQWSPLLLALLVVGVVALLVPIVIFVAVSSRVAGAQRDRRLAALRLVGAGARQTRRIAAAESLVGAGTGLLFGVVLFLLARQVAPNVNVLTYSVFTQDIMPSWGLLVLVLLLVPVIAIGSSMAALRRTVIEPLGVVRESRPVRRRLGWRLGLLAFGAALMFLLPKDNGGNTWILMLATGASALLIGVPALLPWLLERTVARLRGGPPAWQLAVRRLQLDSGTAARVVGGVAVVVAGAIALQTVMIAAYGRYQLDAVRQPQTVPGVGTVEVNSSPDIVDQVTATLRGTRGVRSVAPYQEIEVQTSATGGGGPNGVEEPDYDTVTLISCPVIEQWFGISNCVDGQVFRVAAEPPASIGAVAPGQTVPIVVWQSTGAQRDTPKQIGSWTAPTVVTTLPRRDRVDDVGISGMLVTPGAFHNAAPAAQLDTRYRVQVTEADANEIEYLRNALAPYTWKVQVYALYSIATLNADQKTLVALRDGLLAGALFTLLLAGASLLVLALEQIRERRRALAALAAAGVPRSLLARSLLWQTAIPVAVGVVMAALVGLALAALVLRQTSVPMFVDWSDIGMFCGAGLALVLLVTAATLPALRGATRLSALRTE
jgi:hypothetical protein